MELLCWALLKHLYLLHTLPGFRIVARNHLLHAALALTPWRPQAKWMHRALLFCSVCSHSAGTAPQARRGAETAPLPFPPPPAPGGVPEAPAAFRGWDAGENNAAGWEPGDAKLHTPDVGLATTRALLGERQSRGASPRHRERLPKGRERRGRPGLGRSSQRTSRGQSAAPRPSSGERGNPPGLASPGTRTHRGSRPRAGIAGSGGTGPRPPSPSSARRAQEGTWRGSGARPHRPAAAPAPPVPSPGVARERAERREPAAVPAGGCPARVSAFSLGGEDIFTVAAAPLPHRAPAPQHGPANTAHARRVNVAAGGAVPRWAPGPAPAGRGRAARNRRALRREGSLGSYCDLRRPVCFICRGEAARAVNSVVVNRLRVPFK